jgi:hypothetical protein
MLNAHQGRFTLLKPLAINCLNLPRAEGMQGYNELPSFLTKMCEEGTVVQVTTTYFGTVFLDVGDGLVWQADESEFMAAATSPTSN